MGVLCRLDAEFQNMLDQIALVTGPEIWRKVDVIREARSKQVRAEEHVFVVYMYTCTFLVSLRTDFRLQLAAFNESTVGLLQNIFFVRQLRAMEAFFGMAQQHAATLHGASANSCLFDDEQLAKPIKFFIAEYVRKHVRPSRHPHL